MNIKTWQERLIGLDRPTDFAERCAAIAEAGELRREVKRMSEALETTTDLNFAIDWLDRNRDRAHATDCRSREPNAQCSCGLHRVLSVLRQARNDAELGRRQREHTEAADECIRRIEG